MIKTALVNYHVTSSKPQAFHIDAGGEKGKIISPELAATKVILTDLRNSNRSVNFQDDSLAIIQRPSKVVDFDETGSWRETYELELKGLLSHEVGAQEVIVFDHTVRIDDPDSDRKPARNVHSDYSPAGAHQRLTDLVGNEKAKEWKEGHFGFVNIWRPVKHRISNAPLGFVRPSSVKPEDWITLQLVYPDRIGEILGLIANDAHEWLYQSRMTPDEVAIFNIYDNRGLPSIAHSALDRTEGNSTLEPRMSIESRTLVRYLEDSLQTTDWNPRRIFLNKDTSNEKDNNDHGFDRWHWSGNSKATSSRWASAAPART